MATFAAKLRSLKGIDNTTIKFDGQGRLTAGGTREPFSAGNGSTPSVFYVDGNRLSSGDGRSWFTAFKTLAEGLAATHAYQSTSANRAWAHRATLYVAGDDLDEDLTKFSEKTDVIGVGSDDGNKGPRILGNHVLEAASSDTYAGCRFINITFKPEAAGPVVTIPTGQHGIEFIGCKFEWSAASTTGILITASTDMVVDNCRFTKGSSTGFSTAAISIAAGAAGQTVITNSYIDSGVGVLINASTTGEGILIDSNVFVSVTLCVDDDSDLAYLTKNMFISEADNSTIGNCLDFNDKKAAGNILTGSSDTQSVPFVTHA